MAQQQYTNGAGLAYWGSIEWLNGAEVLRNDPCYCGRCLGEQMYGDGVRRRDIEVSTGGGTEHLLHVNPSHLH